MFNHYWLVSGLALMLGSPLMVAAADKADLQQIQNEIKDLKQNYESRIQALEAHIEELEAAQQTQASEPPAQAAVSENTVADVAPAPAQTAAGNLANPDISVILEGTYKNLSQDPENTITGFQIDGEAGPGGRGFSLAESEIDLFASVDPYLYGGINLALSPDNEVSVEEAYIQSIGLSRGFTLKAGRFFSGIGYQNEIHQHAWDFFDAPLVYQAFLGTGPTGNYGDDGVQLRWLAPADLFLEFGGEIGHGRGFPGTDRDKNGIGATTLFAHVGGDTGVSQSYRAGVSFLHGGAKDRAFAETDLNGNSVANALSGDSICSLPTQSGNTRPTATRRAPV